MVLISIETVSLAWIVPPICTLPRCVDLKTGGVAGSCERNVQWLGRINHHSPVIRIGDIQVQSIPGERRRRLKRIASIGILACVVAELVGFAENRIRAHAVRGRDCVEDQHAIVAAIRNEKARAVGNRIAGKRQRCGTAAGKSRVPSESTAVVPV